MLEDVNVYTASDDLQEKRIAFGPYQGQVLADQGVQCPESISLIILGGFHPHSMASAAVESLTEQFQMVTVLVLYASRDQPPHHQDPNYSEIHTWTADHRRGYEVRTTQGHYSRCHSPEARRRGFETDPELVRVLAFFPDAMLPFGSSIVISRGRISPAATTQMHLARGSNVLFCAEGACSLVVSTIGLTAEPDWTNLYTGMRFHASSSWSGTYRNLINHFRGTLVDERLSGRFASLNEVAWFWREAWPVQGRTHLPWLHLMVP